MARSPATNDNETPPWGRWLALFMILTLVLNSLAWLTGLRQLGIEKAVEQGAAKIEERMLGEDSPDVVREQIELQRNSLGFWTVLALIQDTVVGPLVLFFRAGIVAVTFSSIAAVSGRRSRFPIMMSDTVRWQGIWVAGLAVRAALMLMLDRGNIDASITLFLPAYSYSAFTWTSLQQLDLFALVGWIGMAWSGRRHEQANIVVALLICVVLAAIEASLFAAGSLLVNLSMRLTLFPQ